MKTDPLDKLVSCCFMRVDTNFDGVLTCQHSPCHQAGGSTVTDSVMYDL